MLPRTAQNGATTAGTGATDWGRAAGWEENLEGNRSATRLSNQAKIDARADRVEHKGLGETSILWQIGRATRGARRKRGLRCAADIFDFHAEVIDPLAPITRRQNRQIDMAVGQVNRSAVLGGFTAARHFIESETRSDKTPRVFPCPWSAMRCAGFLP